MSRFDVVVLQRKLLPRWQLKILRRNARRLVFDFDDAVLYRDSNDRRGPDDPRRRRRFAAVMAAADTIVAGNDFLADCALRAGARVADVHVIPTCVDPGRYPVAGHDPDSGPELVWIGSASTLRGLEQPRAVWSALAASIPGLRIRLICDRFPGDFPIPVIPIAWAEVEEARQLAAGQIGVSWLPDDAWSRGKCGLKVLQYQAAGLPVVANPVGTHHEMVRPGVNGFLATGPAEWVDAVRRLAADPALRRRLGIAARRGVESEYSVSAWSDAFVQSITGGLRTSVPVAARRFDQPRRRPGPGPRAARIGNAPSLKPAGHQT
jgi:glycosyltransferase involved in cell wall biosynthesis